jgi:hypothetical protein
MYGNQLTLTIMKLSILKTTILLTVLTFVASSCKKYDDGPFISVRSKEERMANTWVIENAYDKGNDVTSDYDQYELYMDKDSKAKLTSKYKSGSIEFSFSTEGFWRFENSKNDVRFDFDDDDADRVYEILRLKEKELWLKEKGGDTELHLKSK